MIKETLLTIILFGIAAYHSYAQPKKTDLQKTNTMIVTPTVNRQNLLSPAQRDYAVKFLKETEAGFFDAVNNLDQAQFIFKPGTDKWSVEECVKHIAVAEENLWVMAAAALKLPANPEKRSEIRFTDTELINAVEDRSNKSKTFTELEPANSPYQTMSEALNAFKKNREKLIDFVITTQNDLRNHVLILPIGTYDVYQFILLISAHTNRHTQQIIEVKANAGFPKH